MAESDTYFNQGIAYYEAQNYAAAVDMFTKALRLSLGDLAEMLLYRGLSYANLEAYDKALADFNGALERNPYLADAYNERGNVLSIQGDLTTAIRDYTLALELDESHYAAFYNRGLAYEQLQQLIEADADLTESIRLNPSIASAYEARGRVRAMMQRYDGAIADLERYLRMGGGREFDNHSETQSYILNLRMNRFLSRFVPARFLPGNRV